MPDDVRTRQHTFDPRGYWAALGVGPLASTREITAAFKAKKRNLHPDNDPGESAAREFLVATEAYRVLRHQATRKDYAAQCLWQAPAFAPEPSDPVPAPLSCWRCGQITAQPRYLIFHRVTGIIWTARRHRIAGIFCRDCADRTAIGASTMTWLLGWWAPMGPLLTIIALLRNAAGGTRPRPENYRVLMHQARVFLDRERHNTVRTLAKQARRFAKTPDEQRSAESYLAIVGRDENRQPSGWGRFSGVGLVQGLSVAAVLFAGITAAAILTLRGSTVAVSAPIVLEPVKAGETRYVAVDALELRQSPKPDATILLLLDRFTTVQVLGAEPGGIWARISVPNGVAGYAETRYLFGGDGHNPRLSWCAAHAGDPPENGEVLLRRTGGDHALRVANATGSDVLVRLKSARGETVVAFYLLTGGKAMISDIPDGIFSAMYATGRVYSRPCETFVADMQAFLVPAQQMDMAGTKTAPVLILAPPGGGADRPQPAPLSAFIDQ
jgi:hypothetical protein